LLRASDSTLASLRTDLSFGHVKAKHHHIVSFASRPADFASGHDWTNAPPQACFHSGQIGALTPRQADFIFGHIGTNAAPHGVLFLRPNRGPYATSNGLYLWSYRDRRGAPGVLLLRPNRGPYAASSGLYLRSYRDRRSAPGVLLPRPNRGPYAASSGLYLRLRQ
jgi:hypothetical protein